jgi:dolichol-phosphate mannosyltransferase
MITVIIPTYNERQNVRKLIEALEVQFRPLPDDCSILVVDDQSPDGTADVVRDVQRDYANVHLLEGKKAGLGAAYIRGMRYALDVLSADVVFEMDADFSHKPSDVPRLFHELERGADFVIGSRYIAGGSIPNNWGSIRKLNSRFGNLVARFVAGLYRIRDCTAGFRAIRGTLLRDICLEDLRVQGYAFQVALLYEAVLRKAKIREIPVDFVDRNQGNSKLGPSDVFEFIVNAWWIRFRSSATFIKFALTGFSGTLVNLGCFSLFLNAGLNKYVSSPIAIEISIITNFLLNNYWTFRRRYSKDSIQMRGMKFNLVSLVSLAISYSTFIILTILFPAVPPHVHQLIGILPASLINYFLNSYWTFKHSSSRGMPSAD